MSVERARVLLESGAYRVVEVVPADGREDWGAYRETPFVVEVGPGELYMEGVLPEEIEGLAAGWFRRRGVVPEFVPIGGGPGLPEAAFRTLNGALVYLGELEHLERTKPEDAENAFWRLTERMTEARR